MALMGMRIKEASSARTPYKKRAWWQCCVISSIIYYLIVMENDAAHSIPGLLRDTYGIKNAEKEVKAIVVQKARDKTQIDQVIVLLYSGQWVQIKEMTSYKDTKGLVAACCLPVQPFETGTGFFLRPPMPATRVHVTWGWEDGDNKV
jgi:hypothetical protein